MDENRKNLFKKEKKELFLYITNILFVNISKHINWQSLTLLEKTSVLYKNKSKW